MNAVKYLKETYDLKDDDIFTVMMTIAEQVINFESDRMAVLIWMAIEDLKREREKKNG